LEKGDHLLLNQLRHKTALEEALRCLRSAREALPRGSSPELIAVDVHGAVHHLGEMVGEVTTEHILENIFSRFCIGK
jgi:tRNA modification GTPase